MQQLKLLRDLLPTRFIAEAAVLILHRLSCQVVRGVCLVQWLHFLDR